MWIGATREVSPALGNVETGFQMTTAAVSELHKTEGMMACCSLVFGARK